MMLAMAGIVAAALWGLAYERISRRRDARRPPPGQMIDVGGYRLHMTDRGQGGPTVVLLHGAGDCSYSWIPISKELSRFARVITFDRPGLGSSEPGPAPSPEHTVRELHQLLGKAGIPGPYLLVGHSFGGLIARQYAQQHPEQVAGMVFLDSTHEFLVDDAAFRRGFAAVGMMLKIMRALSSIGVPRLLGNVLGVNPMFGSEKAYYKKQLSSDEYRQWKEAVYRGIAGKAAGAEFRSVGQHLEIASRRLKESAGRPQFADLPIAVLCNPGFGDNWLAMQKELASRSTNAYHKVSDRKGHSLQMPRPEYVIEAIRHVTEQARLRDDRTLADRPIRSAVNPARS